MENNEIINDEVIEATTDLATTGLSKGFKINLGVGLTVLAGVVTYKCVIKPVVKKIKAKRAQKAEAECFDESENEDEIIRVL